jgi:DHA1 family tetracycline resistance protein-like MFS transporter
LSSVVPESPPARRAAVAFILANVVMDVLAFGIVVPVLPKLIEAFQGGNTALAALTYGVFATAWALMQFLFSPLAGVLSDRFGRRPVLLISLTGLGLDYLLMAMAPTLTWLFIGRVISGITAATYSTAAAYIADITPPEKRAQSFGYVGAAWGFGFVFGPALAALLSPIHPRLPFYVAAALTLANAAYGWVVLPESLPKDRRSAFSWKRANPIGSLLLIRARRGLAGLFTMQVLRRLAHYSLPSVFVLYAGYRYGWDNRHVGWTLAFIGVCTAIVQGGLVGPIVRRIGERRAALIGLAAETVSYLGYAFAPTGALFVMAIPIGALAGLYSAAADSLLTQRVSPAEQGELQGAASSLMGLVGLAGPGLFTASFAIAITPPWNHGVHLPGAPFVIAALMTATSLSIAFRVARTIRTVAA